MSHHGNVCSHRDGIGGEGVTAVVVYLRSLLSPATTLPTTIGSATTLLLSLLHSRYSAGGGVIKKGFWLLLRFFAPLWQHPLI